MITESEKITEIIPALIAARKAVKPAVKREDSHYGKYADLAEIIDCSNEALLANGLFLSQPTIRLDEIDFVKTQISHISGQFICSYTKIINGRPNDPQAQGSAITYARRYGYEALFNIQRADDDGEGAMPKGEEKAFANSPGSSESSASTQTATAQTANGVKKVSKSQAGLIFHKLNESGFTDDQRKEFLLNKFGVESNYELPYTAVKEILDLFDKGELVPLGAGEPDDIPF